jgi:hypothetical protein
VRGTVETCLTTTSRHHRRRRPTYTQKPGYYPASDGSDRKQWWNGLEWTDTYRKNRTPQSAYFAALKTRQRVAIMLVFAAIAVALWAAGVIPE